MPAGIEPQTSFCFVSRMTFVTLRKEKGSDFGFEKTQFRIILCTVSNACDEKKDDRNAHSDTTCLQNSVPTRIAV